jgi:hypothetical protein
MEKKLSVLGIDIAKQVFHLVGMHEQGTILLRKRLSRAQGFCQPVDYPLQLHGEPSALGVISMRGHSTSECSVSPAF